MIWASTALLLAIGAATGLLSGLFGVGGGFVLVPLLVLIGHPLPVAIGTSLVYVALIGLGGALAHFRARNLDGRFVATLAVPAIAGAQAGAFLSVLFPNWVLALAFAAFLLLVAASMGARTDPGAEASIQPALGPTLGLGVAAGVLSGLFGVGGGVILVPGQVRLFGTPIRRAVGNSLAAIVVTGLSGVVTHTLLGHVDWRAAAALVPGGFVGVQGGTWLLGRIAASRLKALLVAFMVVMALDMAYRGAELYMHLPGHTLAPHLTRAPARSAHG